MEKKGERERETHTQTDTDTDTGTRIPTRYAPFVPCQAGGAAKKKAAQSGPSLMKPLGHVETVTIIKRKAELDNSKEQRAGGHASRTGSDSSQSAGSAHADNTGQGTSGASTSANNGGGPSSSGDGNSTSKDGAATTDAEPFRHDPLAYELVEQPYSPWK